MPPLTVPTVADLVAWADLKDIGPAGTVRHDLVQQVLDAVLGAVDAMSLPWPADPDAEHPGRVPATRQAVLIQAHRIWTRRNSPQGAIGFGAGDQLIRVARVDPDVEALLRPWHDVPEP